MDVVTGVIDCSVNKNFATNSGLIILPGKMSIFQLSFVVYMKKKNRQRAV